MKNKKLVLVSLVVFSLLFVMVSARSSEVTSRLWQRGDSVAQSFLDVDWNFDKTSFEDGNEINVACAGVGAETRLYINFDNKPVCDSLGCSGHALAKLTDTYRFDSSELNPVRIYYACWNKDVPEAGVSPYSYAIKGWSSIIHVGGLDGSVPSEPSLPLSCEDGYHWDSDYEFCLVDEFEGHDDPSPEIIPDEVIVQPLDLTIFQKILIWLRDFIKSLGLGSFVDGSFQGSGGGVE